MLSFAEIKLRSELEPHFKSLSWLSFKKHLKRKLLEKYDDRSLHFIFSHLTGSCFLFDRFTLLCCVFKSLHIVTEAVFLYARIKFFVCFCYFLRFFLNFVSSLQIVHVSFCKTFSGDS